MAFDDGEIKQLKDLFASREELQQMFDRQKSVILTDVASMLDQQKTEILMDVRSMLQPIVEDLKVIRERVDQLFEMEHEDVKMLIVEIDDLKKRLAVLEKQVNTLKAR